MRYRHPVVGPMTVHYEASALGDEYQLLDVYSVEPGTPAPTRWRRSARGRRPGTAVTSGDHARQDS
jgi:hypothetical protein